MSERYQQTKHKIKVSFASKKFAVEAGLSLFKDVPSNPSVRRRPFVNKLALSPALEPLNREGNLYGKFLDILDRRHINNPTQNKNPYWMPDTPYNIAEVIGTSVQFIDQHGAPLPNTTLPPAKDVETFINNVLQEPGQVTIDRQFELLLDITDNNVIGAANIGMLATRYMSRFGDQRAYPALTIGDQLVTPETSDRDIENVMSAWNDKIARFETYHDPEKYKGRSDGTGDSYYFWTHFFAASILGERGVNARVFEKGNELMIFAKDKIARRGGVVSSHYVSSQIGRHIGLALREYGQDVLT